MQEVKITNLVKVYTILLLRKRPMHGYELIKSLGSILLKDVSSSHVYPFLKVLQKNGLVSGKASGNRERREYMLTGPGKEMAQKLIDRFAELVDISISPGIKACAHCGCKVASGGYNKKVKGRRLMFCCVRCADAFINAKKF